MQISLQNFSTLVQNMSASAQGACASLADLTVGSVTRAIMEASASVALWLQYLILQVMSMCRLATSSGTDVDSWVGDFGLTRLPGSAATGTVTMVSLSPASQSGVVAPGATVRTSDGAVTFTVIADTNQPAWSPQAGAYIRAAGTASINVTVQANVPGSAANVQAGAINLLGQTVSGIDAVSNPAAFVDGVDAESDASLKARFANYINTRSRATADAVRDAVASVRQGLSYVVEENVDAGGNPRPGSFLVVVDDGTGSPPASLLGAVSTAVDAVRPIGSGYAVVGPTVVPANVSMLVTFAAGSDQASITSQIATAIADFIAALGVGEIMPFSRLAAIAYGVGPGVLNVSGVTLNGGQSDLGGGAGQVVRLGTLAIA